MSKCLTFRHTRDNERQIRAKHVAPDMFNRPTYEAAGMARVICESNIERSVMNRSYRVSVWTRLSYVALGTKYSPIPCVAAESKLLSSVRLAYTDKPIYRRPNTVLVKVNRQMIPIDHHSRSALLKHSRQ
jgi:hypothetical protein